MKLSDLNIEQLEKIKDKIKIIPHGVDLNLFKPPEEKPKRPFTFLCSKGWRGGMEDRGGVQYVLKAFSEEFTPKDDVRLIIKLNPAYLPLGFDFAEEMNKIGIKKKEKPEILISTIRKNKR